jgi:hypothetical protein
MSKLQEQGTFQTYLSFLEIDQNNGVVPVPIHLCGNYDLTVQQLDISSDMVVNPIGSDYDEPLFLHISSPNISSSLSNVQGWMFAIPVTTRTHHYTLVGDQYRETQVTQQIQQNILPSRQTFASSLSNQFVLQFDINKGLSGVGAVYYPNYSSFEEIVTKFQGGAIVITWAYKRI